MLALKHETTMFFKRDFALLGGDACRIPDEVLLSQALLC
jgi:hypothetical protein